MLNLYGSRFITDEAVVAIASKCKQLKTLDVSFCGRITEPAVMAVVSKCTQLTSINLSGCVKIDSSRRTLITEAIAYHAKLYF